MFINVSGKWAQWSSNNTSIEYSKLGPTALQDYELSRGLVEFAKKKTGADFLWGGYGETRDEVLKGTYLDEGNKYVHLGCDFFVPEGTAIKSCNDSVVLQVYCDTPEECGWGTRIMLSVPDHKITLIYGHLEPIHHVKAGDFISKGSYIGHIGSREENGGWSPHLHLQAIRGSVDEFLTNPEMLDGYGPVDKYGELLTMYPNPLPYVNFNPGNHYVDIGMYVDTKTEKSIDYNYYGRLFDNDELHKLTPEEIRYYRKIGRI